MLNYNTMTLDELETVKKCLVELPDLFIKDNGLDKHTVSYEALNNEYFKVQDTINKLTELLTK